MTNVADLIASLVLREPAHTIETYRPLEDVVSRLGWVEGVRIAPPTEFRVLQTLAIDLIELAFDIYKSGPIDAALKREVEDVISLMRRVNHGKATIESLNARAAEAYLILTRVAQESIEWYNIRNAISMSLDQETNPEIHYTAMRHFVDIVGRKIFVERPIGRRWASCDRIAGSLLVTRAGVV